MMKYPLVYGGLAGAIAICLVIATMVGGLSSHTSVWLGYLAMLVALSLIYIGLKRFRDSELGGSIGFGRAFGTGAAMAAMAGIVYALGWELYLAVSGTDFMAEYSTAVLKEMRSTGASAQAISAKAAELRQLAASYDNPLIRLPMSFAEIFPVGLVVAFASAAMLRKPAGTADATG